MPSTVNREEFIYGNENCFQFLDATPPVCGVVDTLGWHCTPCRQALRRARNAFTNATQDVRCQLPRKETANLRAVTSYVTQIREGVVAEAAALRSATADIGQRRKILLHQREADEAQIARIMAQPEEEDLI